MTQQKPISFTGDQFQKSTEPKQPLNKSEGGFTLPELLGGLAAVGLISVVGIMSFSNQAEKAREYNMQDAFNSADRAVEELVYQMGAEHAQPTDVTVKKVIDPFMSASQKNQILEGTHAQCAEKLPNAQTVIGDPISIELMPGTNDGRSVVEAQCLEVPNNAPTDVHDFVQQNYDAVRR